MSRRKQDDNLLEDLSRSLQDAPVWAGPFFAAGTFVAVRVMPYAVVPFCKDPPLSGIVPLIWTLSQWFSWLFAAGALFAWIRAEATKWQHRRLHDRQRGLETIRAMQWPEFERLIAEVYRRRDYDARAVGTGSAPGRGDGGVDIELRRSGELVLVQCKHWKDRKVGVSVPRELLGVVAARSASSGIVVTSGRFTDEAKTFAESTRQVRLEDGSSLAAMFAPLLVEHAPPALNPEPLPQPRAVTAHLSNAVASPTCPRCGASMILRTAKHGALAGKSFWGCSTFGQTRCRGTQPA